MTGTPKVRRYVTIRSELVSRSVATIVSCSAQNDETPGRIEYGREFRETETGSSGNYPNVGSSRKSLTCGDLESNHTAGTADVPTKHSRATPVKGQRARVTPPRWRYRVTASPSSHPGRGSEASPHRGGGRRHRLHTCRDGLNRSLAVPWPRCPCKTLH